MRPFRVAGQPNERPEGRSGLPDSQMGGPKAVQVCRTAKWAARRPFRFAGQPKKQRLCHSDCQVVIMEIDCPKYVCKKALWDFF